MTEKLKCILFYNFYACGPTPMKFIPHLSKVKSQNSGQGPITLGVISLGRFSRNFKFILLNNFYVCEPTSMTLTLHLVSEVSKVYSQNSGQRPITLGVMSLGRFSKFKMWFA